MSNDANYFAGLDFERHDSQRPPRSKAAREAIEFDGRLWSVAHPFGCAGFRDAKERR
jgi:hypothetical protein